MKKKAMLCCLICFVFLLSLTACADDPAPVPVINQGDGNSEPSEEQKPDSVGDIPIEIRFDSMHEIEAFFSERSNDQINSSMQPAEENIFQYATQNEAVKISETAAVVKYPVVDPVDGSKRVFRYRPSGPAGPYLSLRYRIDGIQYSFTYFYNLHSALDYAAEYGGELAYSNVQIGPYVIDLYKMDHNIPYLIGYTLIDGFVATIRIRGEGYEDKFDFSKFEFVSLSDVSEDEVA